jgi:Kef-type K+ transport system membrane component KefB/nucleotide-binding universal stress UspA family protein
VNAVIEPIDHHAVVILLLQLGLLLLTARGLGQVAVRFGLPSVVGELLAGVVLGPSLLGTFAPGVFETVVPFEPEQFHLLEVVSMLGVLMLLVVTGMETDLQLIRQKGRSAAAISLFGIAIPFGAGVVLGQFMPEQFIADPSQRLVFSLFLGTAMGISAIPVIAKVLIEMNVVRRDIGQITLAAGMIDDTIGWILLSVVAGLARSGVVEVSSVMQSLLAVVAVVGLSFTVGRRLVERLFRSVDNSIGGDGAKITLLMVLTLLFGAVTHQLGIEAVLGAFLVGILVGQLRRFGHQTRHMFETMTMAVFAPIFFAASGLRVDLTSMADPTILGMGLVVLAVAIVGKFVGAAVGAKLSGMGKWESVSLGAGMNARGAIEIIVATIGLSLGILTPEMYTIILMVAIVTSLMAPPILRWSLQHIPYSDEERERIESEQRRATSFLGNIHRILLPTRGGANSQIAAGLLGMIVQDEEVEVTTMSVLSRGADSNNGEVVAMAEQDLESVERHLSHVPAKDRRRVLQDPVGSIQKTILGELTRGYDLLVLGAADATASGATSDAPLFGDVVDTLVQDASTPVMVVSHRTVQSGGDHEPLAIRRILLPTAGAEAGQHAVEVAAAIAKSAGAGIDVVHVVETDGTSLADLTRHGHELGTAIVDGEAERLRAFGVNDVRTVVERANRVEVGILEVAARFGTDLIVLSASRRPLTQRIFFGHRADRILSEANCPVVLVS